MNKNILRKEMLEKMKLHSETSEKSEKIMHSLMGLDSFKTAKDIFVYLSQREEVSTRRITEMTANKNVYAPIVEDNRVFAGLLAGRLRKGKFGIMEPYGKCEKTGFDVVIVPGVVFDEGCARIGRGGGYFDKFLASAGGKKIGLAFDFQVIKKIPSEPHDVVLDIVVTEKRVLQRL